MTRYRGRGRSRPASAAHTGIPWGRTGFLRASVLCALIAFFWGTACAPSPIEGGGLFGPRFRITNLFGWVAFERDDWRRMSRRQKKRVARPGGPEISCSLSAPKEGSTSMRQAPAMVYVTEIPFTSRGVTLANYLAFFKHCGLSVSAVNLGQANGFLVQGAGGPIATGLPGYVSEVFLIPSGDKVVRIDCAAAPERYREFKSKFQAILATFQWVTGGYVPGSLQLLGQSQERKLQVRLAAWFAGIGGLAGVIALMVGCTAMGRPCRQRLVALHWRVIVMLVMVLSFGAAASAEFLPYGDWDFRGGLAVPLALCVFLGTFTVESSKALLRLRRINRRLWSSS